MSECIMVSFFSRNGERENTRMALKPPSGLGGNAMLKPRGDMKSLKKIIEFQCIARNCGGNVKMNMEKFEELCKKPLHIVCGSFGLRNPKTKSVWWEWGSGDYESSAQDLLFCKFTGMKNCHFWLEDVDGHVYDVIDPYIPKTVAPIHKIPLDLGKFICECIVMGLGKDELERCGMVYLPARPDVQERVIQYTETRLVKRVVT